MGIAVRQSVFAVSDKTGFKPVSPKLQRLAKKNENLPVASLHMILDKKQTTKALIRLRGCAGWSVYCSQPLKTGFLATRPI